MAIIEVVDGADEARYNKIAAQHLSARCQELGTVVGEMLSSVPNISASLEMEVKRLVPLLDKCKEHMAKFKKRSYLSRLLMGESDKLALTALDKEITDVVQSIGLSLNVQNIAMSQETLKRLDKLDETSAAIKSELASNTGGGTVVAAGFASAPPQLDPSGPAVSMLVREFGMDLAEVRDQLNAKLDKIQDTMKENNDSIQKKLDALLAASTQQHALDLSTYDKALYPPEDPHLMWSFEFEGQNKVCNEYFIEWWSAQYIPSGLNGRPPQLTDAQISTLIYLIDAYPKDGKEPQSPLRPFFAPPSLYALPHRSNLSSCATGQVSLVEFKRFCRQVAQSQLTMYDFLCTLSLNEG